MVKNTQINISRRKELLLAAALIALGFFVRLYALGRIPFGLNQDEASVGYDALALLLNGTDRCGNRLPVLLEAWGSGQNILQCWLSVPFIAALGLDEMSVRIVPALSGCAALLIMWRLSRRARGAVFGLAALFFLAFCPWHITASRWALESNLLPTTLLAGVYFTVRAGENGKGRSWFLLPAAMAFALSLYAYGTAYFFLPPFLVGALILLRKKLRPASLLVSLAVFIAIALPISLCQLRNALGLPAGSFLGLSLPALTESRQTATSVFGGGGLTAMLTNFRAFLNILLTQSDGLSFNSLGLMGGGLVYFFGLPLCILGVVISVRSLRDVPGEGFMLLALGCCVLSAFFIDVNINRINMIWLPLCYFAALGLYWLLCNLRWWSSPLFIGILVCFCLFIYNYVNHFSNDGDPNYFPGLGQCIQFVEAREPGSAFISYYVNQPYIFTLFYTEEEPGEFIDTVDYVNPDDPFRWVRSYGHWRFGHAEEAAGEYLILHGSEAENREVLASFGQFVVCKG